MPTKWRSHATINTGKKADITVLSASTGDSTCISLYGDEEDEKTDVGVIGRFVVGVVGRFVGTTS